MVRVGIKEFWIGFDKKDNILHIRKGKCEKTANRAMSNYDVTPKHAAQAVTLAAVSGALGGFYAGYSVFASAEKKKAIKTSMAVTAVVAVMSCIGGVVLMRKATN